MQEVNVHAFSLDLFLHVSKEVAELASGSLSVGVILQRMKTVTLVQAEEKI